VALDVVVFRRMCFVMLAVAEFANFLKKLCSQENVAIWLGIKKPI
jgi:hypothetical protein